MNPPRPTYGRSSLLVRRQFGADWQRVKSLVAKPRLWAKVFILLFTGLLLIPLIAVFNTRSVYASNISDEIENFRQKRDFAVFTFETNNDELELLAGTLSRIKSRSDLDQDLYLVGNYDAYFYNQIMTSGWKSKHIIHVDASTIKSGCEHLNFESQIEEVVIIGKQASLPRLLFECATSGMNVLGTRSSTNNSWQLEFEELAKTILSLRNSIFLE